MKHITLSEFGTFIGVREERIVVRQNGNEKEYPINKVKTISIAKKGCSFSSDLLLKCAARGIRFYILDFKGEQVATLLGVDQHAVAKVRESQFLFINDDKKSFFLAKQILIGKIKNQRSTLKYLIKNFSTLEKKEFELEISYIENNLKKFKNLAFNKEAWRNNLLGYEGSVANGYWKAIKTIPNIKSDFFFRTGRKANDITNMALNYGYAILTTYVWNALLNAGLETYSGILHVQRPGKPSLVLDIMEEYRAWVVDRVIVKKKHLFLEKEELTPSIKKEIIRDIHLTFNKKYPYQKKKLRLENILQRQVYRLAGSFVENKKYKPYIFKW